MVDSITEFVERLQLKKSRLDLLSTLWFKNSFLFLYAQVQKSKHFRREGADIHSDVTISLSQAVLGGTIRIPGVFEDTVLEVSPRFNTYHE